MPNVNDRLRENPILQKMPRDEREWAQYTNELAKWVLQVAKFGSTIYLSDGSTVVNGLDEITGQLATERNVRMAMSANNPSIQTSNPLTSVDGGASATINIAAHTLATPSGNIDYNSGTITGLTYGTPYIVYADDTYGGGSVTYLATTDVATLVGDIDRYFVGWITTIGTGVVGPANISITGYAPGTTIYDGGDIVIQIDPPTTPATTTGSGGGGGAWGDNFVRFVP